MWSQTKKERMLVEGFITWVMDIERNYMACIAAALQNANVSLPTKE